jgi:ATP-binding cassette subfamily B protein
LRKPGGGRRRGNDVAVLSVWREIRPVAHLRTTAIVGLAILGAAAGLLEAALVAVVASAALSVATAEDATVKLPLGALDDLSAGGLLVVGVALALGTLALGYLIQRSLARIYATTVATLRAQAFAEYLHADWSVQSSEPDGVFLSYLVTHIPRVATVATALITLLTSGVTLLVFVLAALALSPAAAAGGIALVALLGLAFRPLQARARSIGAETAVVTRQLFGSMVESIGATREIKVFGAEEPVIDVVTRQIDEVEEPAYRSRLLGAIVPVLYQRAVFLLILAALAVVRLLDLGNLGAVGAALLLVLRGLQQAQVIQSSQQQIAECRPWIGELETRRASFRTGRRPRGTEQLGAVAQIELRGAGLVYPDGTVAFRELDLTLPRGELLGIVGPSGSGKTSLAEVIAGLRMPTTGAYEVNGLPAGDYTAESWAQQVAFVSQFAQVVTGSVFHNVAFFRDRVTPEQVRRSAVRAHLEPEVDAMPEGFDTTIADRGERSLSGGQKQRLAIARALAGDPSLVVLDEPTSALDHEAEEAIVETVRELRNHATVVVIAHRLSTLRHCDRVLVLEDGRPTSLGPGADLVSQSDFLSRAESGDWL